MVRFSKSFCWTLLLAGALMVLLVGVAWRFLLYDRQSRQPVDPRLVFDTPYQNVRPEVKYVGSEKCAACHPDQATSYRRHPMGRSFVPIAAAGTLERFGRESHNLFEASGLQFLIELRDGKLFHKEIRRDPRSQLTTDFTSEISYVLGSGTRARAYLIDRDGYLFESAITWFSQQNKWDLSPGFAANPHSDRPVTAECLFCHCNLADSIDQTINHYRSPIFQGYEIGCERCHGPGELHVAKQEAGEATQADDFAIVNPARLSPSLREAVCQQCHLQGKMRILHPGRKPFDFRPGLPGELFWSVFVKPSDAANPQPAVGQVEQMVASRCYAGGQLGCTSCHDPHAIPEPPNKIAHYRDRCLRCHSETSCSRAGADISRNQSSVKRNEDCAGCHMPRRLTSDIAHTAITDHRILRRPASASETRDKEPESDRPTASEGPPLLAFPFQGSKIEKPELSRDFALALSRLAQSATVDRPTRMKLTQDALPLLDAAVKDFPQDILTWQARGYSLWQQNRKEEARASFETALRLVPEHEGTLTYAASLAAEMGRYADAVAYWQRALAVNPWTAGSHFDLARLLVLRREWRNAVDEAQATLKLNPFHLEARKILVVCYRQLGDKGRARAEFNHLLELNPPDSEALHRWFDEQDR